MPSTAQSLLELARRAGIALPSGTPRRRADRPLATGVLADDDAEDADAADVLLNGGLGDEGAVSVSPVCTATGGAGGAGSAPTTPLPGNAAGEGGDDDAMLQAAKECGVGDTVLSDNNNILCVIERPELKHDGNVCRSLRKFVLGRNLSSSHNNNDVTMHDFNRTHGFASRSIPSHHTGSAGL